MFKTHLFASLVTPNPMMKMAVPWKEAEEALNLDYLEWRAEIARRLRRPIGNHRVNRRLHQNGK